MKRIALLVALALAVGLAVGAAKTLKFRYLPERWNRTVDLTEIELACLRSRFSAQRPLSLGKDGLAVMELRAEPRTTHIHLTVQVELKGKPDEPLGPQELDAACTAVHRYWLEKLFRRSLPNDRTCPVTVDLLRGSKVIYRQIRDAQGRRGFENPAI